MDQNRKLESELASMFGSWMKSAAKFWESMPQYDAEENPMAQFWGKTNKGPTYQARKSFETGAKITRAMAHMFSEPENLEAMFRATDTVPEFVMSVSRQVFEGAFEAQKAWAEGLARMGKHEKAYSFEDLDQETFRAMREIYEKEFQKFFNVPQIGLTRFYQERFNRAIDRYNVFQNALSEFIYMFYVPLEKSAVAMREKIETMVEAGEITDNYKDYYNMWIKVLESHYMKLLQSREYTDVLNNTIKSLVEYREAREDMICDMLNNLPIPTNRDMDELYREFYLMKKKIKELSKKLEEKS